MMRSQALQEMLILLGGAVSGQLPTDDLNWALDQSREGDDYDPWVAAASAAELLGGRAKAGRVVKFTADGATFEKAQDWQGWADWLRSRSPRNLPDPGFAFLIV